MDIFKVKEEPVLDLTQDSEEEEINSIKEELEVESREASENTVFVNSRLSIRNLEKSLDQAVEEIRKGGSLSAVASYYGLSEDIIYQTIVSRNVTHQMDILTRNEEIHLVKWILRSNKNNCLVMKQNLLERVGKMKKVSKITPIFARSKFGRMWYEYFLRSNPEIVEDDGVLLPNNKKKEDHEDLVASCKLKKAVVLLYDFRKQKDFLSTLNDKISLPAYLRADILNAEIKSEKSKDYFSEDNHHQLLERNSPVITEFKSSPRGFDEVNITVNFSEIKNSPNHEYEINSFHGFEDINISPNDDYKMNDPLGKEDIKISHSCDETSISGISDIIDPYKIVKKISNMVKPSKKRQKKKKTLDLKPRCEKCQKSFCNKAKLQRHMFTHIPKELYTVSCNKCFKRFPSKYHFLVHLKITHSDNNHVCSDCGKVFKHQTSLRKHFKQVHCVDEKSDSLRSFICDICKKSFKYKNSLEAHIMYGHLKEDKQHVCNICNKRFIKRSLMLRHKTRHSKKKPLACRNCAKSYSRRYLLMQHMEKCDSQKSANGDDDDDDECHKLCQEFMEEIAFD